MEQSKLEEFNQWWIKGKVDSELALPFKRDVYDLIKKHLGSRFMLALVGLRRIGKTTIIYQLIQNLIKENIDPEKILFFSFDEISAKVEDVLKTYRELHNKDFRKERIYVFFDEIQKCDNWENEIKKYYDLYPKLKFVVSGSESLFIKKRTKESLAGRIFEFNLSTFTFGEYLKMHGVAKEKFKYESILMPFFLRYAKKGGFPETFSFESDRQFKEYIRSLVVDKIVYKDIPKIFNIDDPEFLKILLELISTNPGMYIDYQSLSKQFGKDRRIIKKYLMYLKEGFLITILGNYRKGSITTLRKRKRAYPSDNALIYQYKDKIEEHFFGKMAETVVVNKLRATSFWKNGGEVDIVHNDLPIEVKYSQKITPNHLKSLRKFMRKFSKKEAMIITKKDTGKIKVKEGLIKLVPVWKFLLENPTPQILLNTTKPQ